MKFSKKSNILISGAGGGFDFLCGLPLAYELEIQGHSVIYSNYSFTELNSVDCECVREGLYKVTSLSKLKNGTYFPEGLFAEWLSKNNRRKTPIYCYKNIGVLPLIDYFNIIYDLHKINVIIIIDGGVDGIFRGDEYDLGTPSMDSISMIAANKSNIKEKYYVMTAFGSEGVGQEISHAEVLERISELVKKDAYYGVTGLVKNSIVGKYFVNAVKYIFDKMNNHQHSNIVCSILKSIDGEFGFRAVNVKTEINPIWISAFTSMYWFFDLDKTVKMKLFYNQALKTSTIQEISELIDCCRKSNNKIKMPIPI